MKQNQPLAPVVATEYCSQCGREPLCAACANFVFGCPEPIDMRWARLTHRAANAFPRTTMGAEHMPVVLCCRCRGLPEPLHDNPEQPHLKVLDFCDLWDNFTDSPTRDVIGMVHSIEKTQ